MASMKDFDIENITELEFEKEVADIKKSLLFENKPSYNNPIGIVTGGLAGSGKSHLIKEYSENIQDLVVINGDNFRKFHPRSDQIRKIYGDKDYAVKTQEFASLVSRRLLKDAIKARKNVLIEGTFRTSEAPINTLKHFKENGYKTIGHILVCQKDVAYSSTIERYKKAKSNGENARLVRPEIFMTMVANLASNAEKVKNSGFCDEFNISVRRDNEITKVKNNELTKQGVSNFINNELKRPMSEKEASFINQFKLENTNVKGFSR